MLCWWMLATNSPAPLYHVQHRGKDTSQLMNFVGYDAMALGNHEFDDGEETLAAFLSATKFPVISANIDASGFRRPG